MKGKRKGFVVKVAGETFTCVEAKVVLDDYRGSGGFGESYNHPEIWIKFHRAGASEYDRDATVYAKFQRHTAKDDYAGAASGSMDTCARWSRAYGGHIDLEDMDRVDIGAGEVNVGFNKLRLRVSKLIGESIREYNLYHVTEDECERVALALGKLGADVRWMYRQPANRGLCDLNDLFGELRANGKAAADERRAKEREADPVMLWTSAPESYDSGTTKTIETSTMCDIQGNPWRKVAIQPDEVEWHRGRYGSGLYEYQDGPPERYQKSETETTN